MENKPWIRVATFSIIGILVAIGLTLGGHQAIQTMRPQPTPAPLPTETPTPTISPSPTSIPPKPLEKIQIIDGNVCLRTDGEKIKVLVNKKDFESITRFSDVSVSPDKKKMCFLGHTITPIWAFLANIDGTETTKVALAKNCVWSYDSQKIAYNNHVSDVAPIDVYIYDLAIKQGKNLTQNATEKGYIRFYETPRWSLDDQKIFAKFNTVELPDEKTRKRGLSEINLSTGEIKDQILEEGLVDF